MIDMHIHSCYSDGQYKPAEIVEKLKEKNVKIFSLTDHDTYLGIGEAAKAAKKNVILFIPGIELSTEHRGINLHILGYNCDFKSEAFKKVHDKQNDLRTRQKYKTIKYLNDLGFELTLEEVEKFSNGENIGRPHFALAMIDKGYISTVEEAFDKYLAGSEYKKIQLPKISSEFAIKSVKKSGGIPVLAHPVQVKTSLQHFEPMLLELKSYGLMGMECQYSKNSPEQTRYFLDVAKKFNLIHTGGSDFHGEKVKPEIELATGINNSLEFTDYDYIKDIFLKKLS